MWFVFEKKTFNISIYFKEVNERQLRMALQDRELKLNKEFLENFEKVVFFKQNLYSFPFRSTMRFKVLCKKFEI